MQFLLLRCRQPYCSIFNGLKSYQNSAAQRHLHQHLRDEQEFKNIKKTIDYKTINKNSKGKFMIREFLFQEKVEQNYIPPLNCYLMPAGKWTRSDIASYSSEETKTKTEEINEEIIATCTPALEGVFREYYKRLGKPSYKFILDQEIGKIGKMSKGEFDLLVKLMGGVPEETPATK